ncbi:MAG: TIGR02679 domain-containing protein [Bacilli bacterium]
MNCAAEAAAFFADKKGFAQLFSRLRERYQRYGVLGGALLIGRLDNEEIQAIESLGVSTIGRKSVPIAQLRDALARSRFAEVTLEHLLEHFFDTPLVHRRVERVRILDEKAAWFEVCQTKYSRLQRWLERVQKDAVRYRLVHTLYASDHEVLERILSCVHGVCAHVESGVYVRLPVFAHRVSGDPHFFDVGTDAHRILIQFLHDWRRDEDLVEFTEAGGLRVKDEVSVPCGGINPPTSVIDRVPSSAEEVTELLAFWRILRDDIANFVTVYGLTGVVDGVASPLLNGACAGRNCVNLPLREVVRFASFQPFSRSGTVFVVENSGVFSELVDRLGDANIALVCAHGQFKLAFLMLVDRLVQAGVNVYYAGDYDQEGLGMAQRLWLRHPNKVQLFGYFPELAGEMGDGLSMAAEEEVERQSAGLTHPILLEISERMKITGKTVYQEAIIDRLVDDILMIEKN